MKKIFFLVSLLMIVASTSQQTNPAPALTKQDYLQKSKKQKTIAWVLLGGAATFVLTGIIIPKGDLVHEGWYDMTYENDDVKGAFQLTGLLSIIGSIPFVIASNKNNKRAMLVSFKNEPAQQLVKSSFVYKPIPSLNLKISL